MRNVRRGATLIEMVVVMAILVVAAAVAMPSMQSGNGTSLNAAADTVKAAWAKARARAIADGQPYRFAVMANTSQFQVAPDSSSLWEGSSQGTTTADSGSQPLVIKDSLPQGMIFLSGDGASGSSSSSGSAPAPASSGGGSGGWTCEIVFMPDGTTQQDAQIAFGAAGGRSLVLQVRSATGAATTSY